MKQPSELKRLICGAFLFSLGAMMVEVFFTGVQSGPSGSFQGHISLLMAILYWIVYVSSARLFRLLDRLKLKNRFLRAFALVFIIYAFEWSFGALCRAAGFMPWDYTGHGWATDFSHGNITLYLAPFWYLYALIIEPAIRCVRHATNALCDAGFVSWKGFWTAR